MTKLEKCPNCNKNQFNPLSKQCHACGYEETETGITVIVPQGYVADKYGNIRTSTKYTIEDGKLTVSYHYLLEKGKTTLRGEYSKFRSDNECEFPDRLACNYGEGYNRCKNMAFINVGNWTCIYDPKKKEEKNE